MSDEQRRALGARPVFVDTDAGCDDAVALAWLLRRRAVRVVGITTVFGNSSVQNTTANVLTLLAALDLDVPVTMGAAAPLVYPRTGAGALVHGPDGFWGVQERQDLGLAGSGAPGAIAAAARAHRGLTIVALGPLTNIARAAKAYAEDLAGVRLVLLAGGGGTLTPAADFNSFADPHALQIVLDSGMKVEMVTRDAFQSLRLEPGVALRLSRECGPPGQLLAHLISSYGRAVNRHAGPVALPDAAAAIYALHPELGVTAPATVRIVTDGELTRGQTIVALDERHQAALALGHTGVERLATSAADPAFDYEGALREARARAPRNASVVTAIDAATMGDLLCSGLLELGAARVVGR